MSTNQTAVPEAKKESRAAQIVLSLIVFVGFAVLLFVPDFIPGGQGLYKDIIDFFKSFKQLDDLQFRLVYLSFTGFYAILLLFTVISLFVKKKAAFALSAVKTLLGLAVCVYFTYYYVKNGVPLDLLFRDDKTHVALTSLTFMLAFSLIMLFILSISYYKGRGVAKAVSALIAVAFGAFFFYDKPFIGEATLIDLFNFKFSYGTGIAGKIFSYALIVLAFAAAVNLLFALLSLIIHRMNGADLVRSILMLAISAVCFVLLIVEAGAANVFDYLGTTGFFILSIVQFVYTVIVFAVCAAKRKAAEEAPLFVEDTDRQMAINGLSQESAQAAAPAAAPAPEAQPAPAAEETAFADAARANAAFDDASQISIDEIVAENAAKEEEKEEPAQESAQPEEEIAEEKPVDFEQKQHDGRFNRTYSDYQANAGAAAAGYGAPQQPQPPYGVPYGYGAGYAQQYAQNAPGYYGGPIPYLPDAFINSLTPAERDEFDKLFISRIYGDNKRLPVYTVGADNREFFAKIFVFMGRYRTIISEGLLEKIYNYSNSIR